MSTSHPATSRHRRRFVAVVAATALATAGLSAGVGASAADAAHPRLSAACTPTYTPPVITYFSLAPGTVDVRTKSKKVTVTLKATDSDKGVASAIVILASPVKSKHTSSAFASLHRIKGTAKSGTWRGTATVPRWVIPGTWKLSTAFVADKAGATAFLGYSQAAAKHWKRSFKVKSTADLTAPKLTAFSLTPKSVDTRSKSKKVTFTAKAKDSKAGVLTLGATLARSSGSGEGTFVSLKRTKGTAKSGSYKGTATIPKWVGNGTWKVRAFVYDKAGNSHNYTTASLTSHKWRHAVSVKSRTDSTPPALATLSYSPSSINVTNGPKKVNAAARLTDSGAGVRYGVVTWTGPSGFSTVSATLARKTSGSTASGVWKGSATFGCFSEPGVWKASAQVVDVAGKVRTYSTAQLSGSGKPTNLTVANTN